MKSLNQRPNMMQRKYNPTVSVIKNRSGGEGYWMENRAPQTSHRRTSSTRTSQDSSTRTMPHVNLWWIQKEDLYPKRLIRNEGEVGGGCLLSHPFPRDAGAAQELTVGEAGGEFQGHVIRVLLFLWITATGQAHVKAVEVGGGNKGLRSQTGNMWVH